MVKLYCFGAYLCLLVSRWAYGHCRTLLVWGLSSSRSRQQFTAKSLASTYRGFSNKDRNLPFYFWHLVSVSFHVSTATDGRTGLKSWPALIFFPYRLEFWSIGIIFRPQQKVCLDKLRREYPKGHPKVASHSQRRDKAEMEDERAYARRRHVKWRNVRSVITQRVAYRRKT